MWIYSKYVKLPARGPHASLIWPVFTFEFDMLDVQIYS